MTRRWWKRWTVVLGAALMAALPAVAPTPAGATADYQYVRADGSVASSTALTSIPLNELHLAVRGTDNGIYYSRYGLTSGWTLWESLGAPVGGVKGDPALIGTADNAVTLFVRSVDDKLWSRARSPAGVWGNWAKVADDGALNGSPRALARGNDIDVFVLGTDGRVYQRFGGAPGQWIPLDKPASVDLVGDPTSTAPGGAEVDLYARGSDNKLWGRIWNGFNWTDWTQVVPDGVLNSSPFVVSNGQGGVVVFVRGTDNNLYSNERRGGSWGGWVRESQAGNNPFQDNPTAALRFGTHVDVAVRGTNNIAYTYVYRF